VARYRGDVDGNDLRERNRAANMDEVRRVAVSMMNREGFAGVTVAEIAAGSGVSPSTVYRYFGTKEALVLSDTLTDGLVPAVAAAAASNPNATPAELVGRATKAMLADIDERATLAWLQLVFSDAGLTTAFEHDLLGRRDDLADVFAAHRRSARRGVRDDAAAGAVLGILVALLDRWQRNGGEKSLVKMLAKGGQPL